MRVGPCPNRWQLARLRPARATALHPLTAMTGVRYYKTIGLEDRALGAFCLVGELLSVVLGERGVGPQTFHLLKSFFALVLAQLLLYFSVSRHLLNPLLNLIGVKLLKLLKVPCEFDSV